MKKRTPPPCPKCKSTHVLPIVYGLPTFETGEAAQRGEVALGGCIIDDRCREWECADCRSRFNDGGQDLLEPSD